MKSWAFVAASVVAITVTAFGAALPKEEPLWPNGVPGKAIVHKQAEKNSLMVGKTGKAGGGASFVSVPTFMVFPAAKDKSMHAAVVVYPGGGYRNVVLGKEGVNIAQRLNEMGITAVVVKYRTLALADPNAKVPDEVWKAQLPSIIADGKQAVQMVRSRASELGIDPNKIGVMGFSAGGHLAAAVAFDAGPGDKNASDPFARTSCRPDFACLIYPGVRDPRFDSVPSGLGPCFIAVSANDDKTEPNQVMPFFVRLQMAKVPSELHIFQGGGHGFGVGRPGETSATWIDTFGAWLRQNGFVRR